MKIALTVGSKCIFLSDMHKHYCIEWDGLHITSAQWVESWASNRTRKASVILANLIDKTHFHETNTYFALINIKYIVRVCCHATYITLLIEYDDRMNELITKHRITTKILSKNKRTFFWLHDSGVMIIHYTDSLVLRSSDHLFIPLMSNRWGFGCV